MKKASIPVPHILAIVLAILVLGLLAYFLIQSYRSGGGQLSYSECYAKFLSYCATHKGDASNFKDTYEECQNYDFGECPSTSSQ